MTQVTDSAVPDSRRIAEINARIDRMPIWGLSPLVYVVLGFCYLLAFYDIAVIGAALPRIVVDMHLTTADEGLPITSNLIGYVIGAYSLGAVADRLGRRTSLAICVLVLTVGALATAASWDLGSLTLFRFVTGIGIGSQIALTATILGEFSPPARRGRYTSTAIMWAALGNVVTYLLAIPLMGLEGSIGWRLLFGLPAVVVFTLFMFNDRFLPESPRWLAVHGHFDRADASMRLMEARVEQRTGQPLPPVAAADLKTESERQSEHAFATRDLFSRDYFGRLLAIFCFWFFIYIAIYGYLGFAPTLLGGLGVDLPHALTMTMVGMIGGVVGAAVQPFVVDRFERKYNVAVGAAVFILGFVLLAVSHGAGTITVGSFLVAAGIFLIIIPAYTYTSEVFPTRARASAMGIADGWGHLGGAVAPFIVLPILAGAGARAALVALIVSSAISLVIMLFARRTTNRALAALAQ